MTTNNADSNSNQICVSSGIPLHWDRRCFSVAIDENPSRTLGPEEVRQIVETSFATWEFISCGTNTSLDVQVDILDQNAQCNDARFNPNGGNINAISFAEDWALRGYDTGAFAVTTVWHSESTGEILDADIEINEDRGPYGVCPLDGCDDGTVDLQNVLTHEIGHFFGLAHSETPAATMWAESRPGEVFKRVLKNDDIEGFCAIYPVQDRPQSCSFTPTGGLTLTCEEQGGGCACDTSPTSRAISPAFLALLVLLLLGRRTGEQKSDC